MENLEAGKPEFGTLPFTFGKLRFAFQSQNLKLAVH